MWDPAHELLDTEWKESGESYWRVDYAKGKQIVT